MKRKDIIENSTEIEECYAVESVDRLCDKNEELRLAQNRPKRLKQIEETMSRKSMTRNEHLDNSISLHSSLYKKSITKLDVTQTRVSNDIWYGLFFAPHSQLLIFNEKTGKIERIKLIEKIITDALEYNEMRGGDVISNDYICGPMFKVLKETTNTRIQLWCLLVLYTIDDGMIPFYNSMCGKYGYRTNKAYLKMRAYVDKQMYILTRSQCINKFTTKTMIEIINGAIAVYLRPSKFDNRNCILPAEIRKRDKKG